MRILAFVFNHTIICFNIKVFSILIPKSCRKFVSKIESDGPLPASTGTSAFKRQFTNHYDILRRHTDLTAYPNHKIILAQFNVLALKCATVSGTSYKTASVGSTCFFSARRLRTLMSTSVVERDFTGSHQWLFMAHTQCRGKSNSMAQFCSPSMWLKAISCLQSWQESCLSLGLV